METLLEDLEHAAKTPAKQRSGKINGLVEKICSATFERGLSAIQLNRLIDTITLPNHLDQASLSALIKNLYPAVRVTDAVVVNVVASLGHGSAKPSYNVQSALLRWLIMIYDVLENRRVLSQLHSVLFDLLDTLALRTPLCHILSLITRRKHVRSYRIQLLMEMARQCSGNDAPLIGLLRIYKDYYPDVIVRDAVAGRAKVFAHPDEEWRLRLIEIQDSHAEGAHGINNQNALTGMSRNTSKTRGRIRSTLLPDVQTSNASETSTTLEEIDTVEQLVARLENIEPPNQLVAVIGTPLLQRYLQLQVKEEFTRRVDAWLFAFFEDQLSEVDGNTLQILQMLQAVLEYTRHIKDIPLACLAYLKSMVSTWDGVSGREVILELLTYLPISICNSFEAIRNDYLQPLEEAILCQESPSLLSDLLYFYTSLLDRWAMNVSQQSSGAASNAMKIQQLVEHANLLSLTISQSNPSSMAISRVLFFYETFASVYSQPTLIHKLRIIYPPSQLIYILLFTSSASELSRLCSILSIYKQAFGIATTRQSEARQSKSVHKYTKDNLDHFNGYVMDICNCLWRGKALDRKERNALGCLVDPAVAIRLQEISHSPALCSFADTHLRELEDQHEDLIEARHAGPVTAGSLKQLADRGGLQLNWQDYKLGILKHLEFAGLVGPRELMYNTMTSLMGAKKTAD